MTKALYAAFLLLLGIIFVYLFVSAPAPLAQSQNQDELESISVDELFAILQSANATVRTLYTREIVGAGQNVGLSFSEDWRLETVQAGPLPALFLRDTAAHLQSFFPNLTLFLGSDFPLEDANRFEGIQLDSFMRIRQSSEAQYFYMEDVQRYVAMFPDMAVSAACVDCHNNHPNAPKTDWQEGDIMGATTWMYPENQLSFADALSIMAAFEDSIRLSYEDYLLKTQSFVSAPTIGEQWPVDGYYLPSSAVFMAEFRRLSASNSLSALIHAVRNEG